MIQWMHRLSQSWIATLLMGGLALSFVVWGIADVFVGNSSDTVATVGSTEIDTASFQREYRNFVRQESQQMGTEITPDMAEKLGLGQQALEQMISRLALANEAARLKLTTPDSAVANSVRATPAFAGATGQFDHNRFLGLLQNAGYTEQSYLDEVRTDMTLDQMRGAVEGGFALPDGYAKALFQYITERRAADYVALTTGILPPIPNPSDAVLAAYVKAHPEKFSTPEYRDVEYAEIGPQDLAGGIAVSDAQVAKDYDAHKSLYQIPEKRDLQQIEFPNQAEAAAARAKIAKGESFEQVAAERKLKPADLDLGSFSKDDLGDPARADAAFALKPGEVSQPVKAAAGGYVLMRVSKITPPVNRSLADATPEIKKNLALQLAAAKVIDVINAFQDARNSGDDLATAAKKSGMKYGRFHAIDRNGLTPDGSKPADLPADPEFLAQAFAAQEGDDNDPFQAKSGENYAIKVDGHVDPKLKTLDQVRKDATNAWLAEQQNEALAQKAAQLAAQAQREKSLAGIAKSQNLTVQHSPGLTRQTQDDTFSADLVQQIFAARPGGIAMAPSATGFVIAQVTGISHQMTADQQALLDRGKAQLSQQAAGDLTVSLANAVRQQEGGKIDQRMVQSVIGGNQ